MSRCGARFALILLISCGPSVASGQRVEWPVVDGGNGHFYEAVAAPDRINWADAQAAAVATGGYLATITSAEEQAFVYALAVANADVWQPSGYRFGPWLGSLQPPASPEPGGWWEWVTGEQFVYTYWDSGEPNNYGGAEDRIHFKSLDAARPGGWNDAPSSWTLYGYIAEYPSGDTLRLVEGFESPDTIFSYSSTHSIPYDAQNSEAAHSGTYSFKSYTSTCGASCHDEYRIDLLHTFPELVRLIGVELWAREGSSTGSAWGGKISVGHDSTWNLWWWQVVDNGSPITGAWQHVFVPIDEMANNVRIRIVDISTVSTMWLDDVVIHYERVPMPLCGPVLVSEDFEGCEVGTWIGACNGWQTWANGSSPSAFFVTDAYHVSGTQGLQISGSGSCWEGATYRSVTGDHLFLRAMMRASGDGPNGCHHRQNGIALHPVADFNFFMAQTGFPNGGLTCWASGSPAGRQLLIDGFENVVGRWYAVGIELDYNSGLAYFWLDGSLVWSTAFDANVAVENIWLSSGEGRGWFDDVVVCQPTTALSIVAHDPVGLVAGPIDHVDVTFSREIVASTFTGDDVAIAGPDGPVPVDPPEDRGNNVWRVSFAEQWADGDYHVYIGPHIEDLDGNQMDQDGDGAPGEELDDVYDAAFSLGPILQNGSFEVGPNPGGSFIILPAGSIAITGWTVILGDIDYIGGYWQPSDGARSLDLNACAPGGVAQTFPTEAGRRYGVSFDMAGNAGAGPTIKRLRVEAAMQTSDFEFDITGHSLDSMGWVEQNWQFWATSTETTLGFYSLVGGCAGPALDNVRVTLVKQPSLSIVAHNPVGLVAGAVNHVDVTFSAEIAPATFTVDDVAMTGPSGLIAVDPPADQGSNVWRIGFAEQSEDGEYCLSIGPHIEDLAGNEMDQDLDGVFGEEPQDVYVGCFTIDMTPPEIISQTPSGEVNAPVDHVDLTFGETVTANCGAGDIALTGPTGPISVEPPEDQGNNVWRIEFALQTANRPYVLSVAPCFADLAGNSTPELYEGAFIIALPNLTMGDVLDPMPTEGWTGRPIAVGWTVTNTGDAPAVGPWQDCVYLSTDGVIGDDNRLGCMPNPVGLDGGAGYYRVGSFTIPPSVPRGDYWIVVCADDSGALPETDESDNCTIAGPIWVDIEPCADLEPGNVEAPPRAAAGTTMTVTWTVSNVGDGATNVPFWFDRLYLSRDGILDASDRRLNPDFQNPTYLTPNDGYTQFGQQVGVPGDAAGGYFVIVAADARNDLAECSEANNVAVSGSTVYIDPQPLPDLIVLEVSVEPRNPWSGEQITVSWTAKNDDLGSIPAGRSWSNAVFLSGEFNEQQVWSWRGVVWKNGPLAAGETYFASTQVTLPAQYYGPFQICIALDGHEDVAESNESNNVGCSDEFTIRVPPPADLEVSELLVPPVGLSGQRVEINWTVLNGSLNQATWVDAWNDRLILSRDSDHRTLDDNITLGTYRHYGLLAPGGQYSRIEFVPLPVDADGAYFLCILTDADDEVYEGEWENNNAICKPINVVYEPPDLVVEHVTVLVDGIPATSVMSGTAVTVEWMVSNNGSGKTPQSSWFDRIYISTDDILDVENDAVLATVPHAGGLADGESYSASRIVTIPVEFSATAAYVFVCTDVNNQVFEDNDSHDAEENNCASGDPFEVVWAPPDLVVQAVTVEPVLEALRTFTVEWTAANTYLGATPTGSWFDRIYISRDGTLDASDPVLEPPPPPHNGVLGPGETYAATWHVTIPIYIPGPTVYFFVKTDHDNRVYEYDNENNVNRGGPIEIAPGPPDLVVESISAPGGAVAGEPLSLSWTVRNVGGPTEAGSWHDRVYLSADRWLDPDEDTPFDPVPHTGDLDYDATYTANATIDLPPDLANQFYLIVETDSDGEVAESASNETNNTRYVSICLTPLPVDLQVTSVDAPDTALSGQNMSVTWTVANFGIGATPTGFWRDAIYLSPDQYLDPGFDYYLGYFEHSGILNPEDSYTRTESIRIPSGLSGPYYVFIVTDINDHFFEENDAADAEDNNVAYDGNAIQVEIPPPADLLVADILVPPSGTLGEDVTIQWTVRNDGDFDAQGSWHDSVYISADAVWDIGDKKIGKVQHAGPLPPDTEYTESLMAPLPGVVPGGYYLIVRTDIHNEVRESIEGEQNNIAPSTEQINVDCWELVRDDPNGVTGVLSTGTEHYYKIVPDIPEGEDLLITLDCADDSASTELYVRYGAVPDRGHYDFAYSTPFAADHEIVVPSTQLGDYYLLVRGDQIPSSPASYTVAAELMPPGIREFAPVIVGNAGRVTLAISGAGFDLTTGFRLIHENQQEIPAAYTAVLNSSYAEATFDLTDIDPGEATLGVLVRGMQRIVPGRLGPLTIIAGGEANPMLQIAGPAILRLGQEGAFTVTVSNTGLVDLGLVRLRTTADLGSWSAASSAWVAPLPPGRSETVPIPVPAPVVDCGSFNAIAHAPINLPRQIEELEECLRNAFGPEKRRCCDEVWNLAWRLLNDAEFRLSLLPYYTPQFLDWAVSELTNLYLIYCIGGGIGAGARAGAQRDLPAEGDAEASIAFCVVSSFDPNVKIGAAAFGEQLFVSAGDDLPYSVRFENLPDATAPAQQVMITDEVGGTLDWRTFQLGEIALGDMVVDVPEHRAHYVTEVDLANGLIVRIDAGLNVQTGVATWTLTAIDPDTGEAPEDPLLGLLPPNDPETHSGEGYVTFSIRPRPDVPTGTGITNSATIIFDINEPIETNEVFNTIDAVTPSSQVNGPTGEVPDPTFDVVWNGQDDDGGSGVTSYSIYYRQASGLYTLWLTTPETSATFTAPSGGCAYDFYSLASDGAGNTEAPPSVPDTTLTVAPQVPPAPTLGTATAVTVRLLDLGRINAGCSVEHSVFEETTGLYVGGDGRLNGEPFWQPLDQWANLVIRALPPVTDFSFRAKARFPETELGLPATATTSIQGDVDGDALVTQGDVGLVQAALGTQYGDEGFDARADLHPDDWVTFADLGIVLANIREGDYNRDGFVTIDDYAAFYNCVTGPLSDGLSSQCAQGDFDRDDDIDLADFAAFQREFGSE